MRTCFLLPLLALVGCPDTKGDDTACTDIAIASAIVNVSTSDGSEPDFVVEWSQDGGAPTACEVLGDPGQFVCGYEIGGEMDIDVSAEGYEPQRLTVVVEERPCHVTTETVDVTLERMPVE